MLEAGPSVEQLAVAQTVVDRAQLAAGAAQDAYDALPEAALDTPDGRGLAEQLDQAKAGLANAEAQYDLAAAGPRAEQLGRRGAGGRRQWQATAADAQAAAAQAALDVIDVQIEQLTVSAPVDGVVLARAIEPGEVASPGATLLVVGQLDDLNITVFVPETAMATPIGPDRHGRGQLVSGPDFRGTVTHIAEQAEFTPRNVQTAEGRKTTVFAVKLALANPDGQLKPGMPADVTFDDGLEPATRID